MRTVSFILIVLYCVLTSATGYGQDARWIAVPQVRVLYDDNIRDEIRSRLPNTSIMSGEDIVGQGHYGGHGMNSYLRGKYGRGTDIDNASYFFGGYAFIAPEPTQFTLREVLNRTKGNFPGGSTPLQYWNNQPLYVFDELSAYTCGTIAGMQAGQEKGSRVRNSYGYAQDLLRHAKTIVILAKERRYPYVEALEVYVNHMEKVHKTIIEPNL